MSYRHSVDYNKMEHIKEISSKIVTVQNYNKIVNYLYLNDVSGINKNDESQYYYPDGLLFTKLGKSITPKYFKLEYLCIPNTFYQQSNTRKQDTRPSVTQYGIKQNAPLRMVWRERLGMVETTFNVALEPGNYTLDEFIIAVQAIMNTSPNNQYTITFNEITMRSEINRISGTYDYALWFATTVDNTNYYINDVEQFCSVSLGYDTIPLGDPYTSGANQLKISPLVMDLSNDAIFLLEIEGTPSILNRGKVNQIVSPTFNGTFIINYNGNKGDYSTFTINKDFENKVVISNKLTYENLKITLRDFETGDPIHLNGNSPYIVFSYEEYGLNENIN